MYVIGLIIEICTSILILTFHEPIINYLSSDPDVRQNSKVYLLFFCFYMFATYFQAIFIGALRACNKLDSAIITNVIFFLLVLPLLGYLFSNVIGMNIWGLILAIIITYSSSTVACWFIFSTNKYKRSM